MGSVSATYALLEEDVDLALIFDIEELLAAVGRERDVQLYSVVSTSPDCINDGRNSAKG